VAPQHSTQRHSAQRRIMTRGFSSDSRSVNEANITFFLNVVMPSVITLSVVMLNVAAPDEGGMKTKKVEEFFVFARNLTFI
jgi:hypothetical protein